MFGMTLGSTITWSLLAGVVVLLGVGLYTATRWWMERRNAQREERIARWRDDPQGMARATAALYQTRHAKLVGRRNKIIQIQAEGVIQ